MALHPDLALPFQFRSIEGDSEPITCPIRGQVLARPHPRLRWMPLLIPGPLAAESVGVDCRFMVTRTEMAGDSRGLVSATAGLLPRMTRASWNHQIALRGGSCWGSVSSWWLFRKGQIRRQDGPIRLHSGPGQAAVLARQGVVGFRLWPAGLWLQHRSRPSGAACGL